MTRGLVAVLLLACTAATAAAEEWPLRGWGVDERLDAPSVIAAALRDASAKTGDVPLFARLDIGLSPADDALESGLSAIDTRIREYEGVGVPALLVIDIAPEQSARSDGWVRRVRAIGERFRGRVAGYQIGRTLGRDPRAYAFLLKLAAVQLRSIDTTSIIVQATGDGDLATQDQLHAEGTIPYVDAVAVDGARGDVSSAVAALHATLERDDPTARIIVGGIPLMAGPSTSIAAGADAAANWLRAYFSYLGNTPRTTTFTGTREELTAAFRAASALRDVLAGETVTLDEQAAGLRLMRGTDDITSRVAHRLLYNLSNFSTYLVYWSDDDDGTQPIRVELTEPSGREPMVRDTLTTAARRVSDFKWDPGTKRVQLTAPPATRPLVLDFNYGAGDVYVARSEVVQAADLKVEEIIFRYQQAQAAQDALVANYVANVVMEQHFRATVTDSYDVVTENRFYVSKGAVEWEELSFSVNGAKWGPDRPPFPLLQAEKVLSLPLDLRLGTDYRYTLRGSETISGRRCYIVEFEPLGTTRSLYRGRVWIDAERFVRLKLQAVQTRLDVPVVSNEETHTFQPVGNVQGRDIYFLTRLSSKQIVMIAGRNLLLEKEARFSDFRVNPPDFETVRGAAHDSDHIMYRDTDAGLRYLVKQGEQRVVSEMQTTRAKAMAFGTTIDPSYAFPLPMFGINYLDFEFLGNKNSQLALLFAGVLALGNVQRPRLFEAPIDLSVDFFAIAVPTSDRVYDSSGEREDERLQNIPFSTGANFGYQFTDFQKVSASYQFRYDFFFRDRDTPESFVTPSSTVTHGGGLAYEFRRGGYTVLANGAVYRRATWRPWGSPEALVTGGQTYEKYTAGGSKDVFIGPFQKLHFNAQWFGGRDLDRFSMYQFGLFDETRMHGVPASGVRFEELAMARASYSFNVFDQYRFDLFLDRAVGRTPEAPDQWLNVTGTGVALNLRAPWNTMLRVDAGKSFLPDLYRGLGSVVVQVLVLKPL